MNLSINFDPSDPGDVALAASVLQLLPLASAPGTVASSSDSDGSVLKIVQELLDVEEYGKTRLGLVRMIAQASPATATKADVYAEAKSIDDTKHPGFVMGGLHKSLEQSWATLGGSGEFFHTSKVGFTMDPNVAAAVLAVLD